MFEFKNEKMAIPVVVIAGLFWSFGPLVVRYIEGAELVTWQYLLARGLVIFILVNAYLYFDEGLDFYKNYLKIGLSGFVGGIGLAVAMTCFILSITQTTAAVTLLCLVAMPLMTALLGFLFLNEKIENDTWTAIIVASSGIGIMAYDSLEFGTVKGLLFGIGSAFGFSIFSVSLRWKKETPKFTTVALGGLFCFLFSLFFLIKFDLDFLSSSRNQSLFALHGSLVCLGLILYSMGAKAVQAAELTMLSLTEVVGGIFWVWIPIMGINEIPSSNTIVGGFLIFVAIFYYSLMIKNKGRFIGLN